MLKQENLVRLLPDVALHGQPYLASTLDWVGMADIQTPVVFDPGDGQAQRASARVGAFVNLKQPEQRGIHMSRLYLRVEQALSATPLSFDALHALLRGFIESQGGLADCARITISFEQLVRRTALRSQYSGWRAYPVTIEATLIADEFALELTTEVMYSSTCPASAALSRQLIQEQFDRDFPATAALDRATVLAWLGSERGIVATPHAQRSVAQVRVTPVAGEGLHLLRVLDAMEHALGTPVQTAVKREDEQAFALANGSNLMFCEDAARRICQALEADVGLADFHVRVEHQESLHPHDAVACASKGTALAK
ncbi:MAG: GTP cyclohydrolase FolE2 [Rhodanobacter sp.]